MSYRIEFVVGAFDVIVTTSEATSWDELSGIDGHIVADPRFRPGMNVLYDYGSLDPSRAASADEMRAAAVRDGAASTRGQFGRIAIAAANDTVFGLGRMWLAFLAERAAERTTIVRSRTDAYHWLAASRSLDAT